MTRWQVDDLKEVWYEGEQLRGKKKTDPPVSTHDLDRDNDPHETIYHVTSILQDREMINCSTALSQ